MRSGAAGRRWYRSPLVRVLAGLAGAAGLLFLAIPILVNLFNPMVWWDAPIGVGIGVGFLGLLVFAISGQPWVLWFSAPAFSFIVAGLVWGIVTGEIFR